ncbi:heat shock protein 70 [Colletotrichum scovillei]|uniref:Heat shock protein 70 n=2 Tax=Colletotrichum scovillei TaxID=1209932 RepID=A0A9P7R2D2_9PEZI|nr:heat shock protein 70 [Colletotrichum scovillei]KAG7056804.1 heat shock protein 70 [Colletotrichum scovillei]KAG7066732.1 heat shock protein 70 [Colletotrichum scovillei]
MPPSSERHRAMGFGLLGFLILSLSLACSGASAFEVNDWEDACKPGFMSISLGPSYASVGKIQRGARRIPLDGQSFTIMGSDELAYHAQSDPCLSSALFDSSVMVCDATEPEYFLHRALKHSIPHVNLGDPDEVHIFRDSVVEALRKLKEVAKVWTLEPIEQAFVTVPQYFTKEERNIITEAGSSVGIEVLRIMNAPTAAAIGLGIDKLDDEFHFIVYDLGRETFEVSLFEVDAGVFEGLASVSDHQLGNEVGELMHQKQLRGSSVFDAIEMETLEKTLPLLGQVIESANLSNNDISKVLIVGGYTEAAQLRSMVKAFFGTGTSAIFDYPRSLRLIPDTWDYDEVVTFGAAVFAENVCGHGRYDELVGTFEVNPRAVLLEIIGGEAHRVFQRYTILPSTRAMTFTTTVDGQTRIVIPVFQGELPDARMNDEVLILRLDCIPPAPRGTQTIQMVLEADVDAADGAYRLLLKASVHLVGAKEQCSYSASGILHDFGAVDALSGEEIELEAAYAYARVEPGRPGICINPQSGIDHHYVAVAE